MDKEGVCERGWRERDGDRDKNRERVGETCIKRGGGERGGRKRETERDRNRDRERSACRIRRICCFSGNIISCPVFLSIFLHNSFSSNSCGSGRPSLCRNGQCVLPQSYPSRVTANY